MTAHPTSHRIGPQFLPGVFHTDHPRALGALRLIEDLDADVLAPGHGPVHHGSPGKAVASARASAEK